LSQSKASLKLWLLGAACAVLPDVDVFGFWFGIPYQDLLRHRGLTHSLAFAAALSILVVALAFHQERWAGCRNRLLLCFFCVIASHGALDVMTNGGLGVAFFALFDNTRYFFPFRPIEVSPLSVETFFTASGAAILSNEFLWIWLPSLFLAVLFSVGRRWQAAGSLKAEAQSSAKDL